ncbi:semaphorin-4D-like isoform X4 [Acipenser oxyrinchus oxyrinchus]|uniref:Semaphorin-4D-like isoform X4 n=1 Tax=Acipenser oxyrinchus oxyrinchus TaxID=40147 RepID=A0AAD8GLQ2_ACIOX|nr:semaphorin-4D-like isoform X4 [Acipenser oxyrinchus oxyrinchus]
MGEEWREVRTLYYRAETAAAQWKSALDQLDAAMENSWSREFSKWRSSLSDHEKLIQSWEKAWESCDQDGIV